MSHERFDEILALVRWGHTILAAKLNCDTREMRRWANGQNPVEPATAAWLEGLAAARGTPPARQPKLKPLESIGEPT